MVQELVDWGAGEGEAVGVPRLSGLHVVADELIGTPVRVINQSEESPKSEEQSSVKRSEAVRL